MSLAALSVFEAANLCASEPLYDVQTISPRGDAITNSFGMVVAAKISTDQVFDTLLVGGNAPNDTADGGLVTCVQSLAPHSRRIASVCTGVFLLAEAGLLAGRRATTHWRYTRALQSRFPDVRVEEDKIFVVDGPIWTCAGMAAAIDLALEMVEQDFGRAFTRLVARSLVLHQRRSGGQSQYSALLDLEPKTDRIHAALEYARWNLHASLKVEDLADIARLSPRQFSRAFKSETGESPAKAIERLRLEQAEVLLRESRHSIETIARDTGFADPERMRRAFQRATGVSPRAIRRLSRIARSLSQKDVRSDGRPTVSAAVSVASGTKPERTASLAAIAAPPP
jgi:transcriptional regulator GlxA family with amidase domain